MDTASRDTDLKNGKNAETEIPGSSTKIYGAGTDEKLVTTSPIIYTKPFSDRIHSLGSHKMNYSVGSQSVPSQSHTESEIVQCESRAHLDFEIPPYERENHEEHAFGCTSQDFKDDEEEAHSEDLKEDQTSIGSPQSSSETRQFSKLHFDPNLSQQKRRECTLQWQRSRRDHFLDKIRNLEGDSSFSDSEAEEPIDFFEFANQSSKKNEQCVQESAEVDEGFYSKPVYRGKHKRYGPTALVTVMLSEWLIDKPDDFEEKWVGVLCPVGNRCVVVASRGKTKIFSRRGYYLGSYPSMLPGGRKDGYCVTGNRSRGVSILDCIWSETSQVFYVLDLLCWNSHPCTNCDTDYRQFFLASKFQENEILLQRNRLNPFPFIPLPYFTAENFSTIMTSSYPPFPEKIDGIIFLHKESFYVSEVNPLCLWLRLCDVYRRLQVSVSPELLEKQEPLREKPSRVDKKRKSKSSSSKKMNIVES